MSARSEYLAGVYQGFELTEAFYAFALTSAVIVFVTALIVVIRKSSGQIDAASRLPLEEENI